MSAVPHDTGLGDSPEVEEFEVIAPQRERVVRFRGEDLTVRPVTIRQLAGFAPHARPLVAAVNERFAGLELSEEAILGAVNLDLVLSLVENYSEHVIGAVAAATGKPADWIADGNPDEFLELTVAVIAVNTDFFVRRLLPVIARNLAALRERVVARSGQTSSSS